MDERVVVRSPAKVNLTLDVLARRADGYHELDTTILALDRFDQLSVSRVDGEAGVRLTVVGPEASPDIPHDDTNLAVRGAAPVLRLARERGLVAENAGLALRLEKAIPSQAGLGGGSSNAAAACYGAARLLGVDPQDDTLLHALERVGSDCAFFLRARDTGLARCTGRGEVVEPLPAPPTERAFAVVTPDVRCATAEVFAAWRPADRVAGAPRARLDPAAWFQAPLDEARAALRNDLEAAALRVEPALQDLRRRLDGVAGGVFCLSGSGSSFFGLFADTGAAEACLEGLLAGGKARDHGLRSAFVARPTCSGVGA